MKIGSYTLILKCDCPEHNGDNAPEFYAGRDESRATKKARADGWQFGHSGLMTCPDCKRRGKDPSAVADPFAAMGELIRKMEAQERPR